MAKDGGISKELNEHFFLSLEVSEIIKFHLPKPWDDLILLTDLYVKKGYSLRRISRELGCNKSVVRKKLSEAGVEIIQQKSDVNKSLVRKIQRLREEGLSYQKIADLFNLWRVDSLVKGGRWYSESVRRVEINYRDEFLG